MTKTLAKKTATLNLTTAQAVLTAIGDGSNGSLQLDLSGLTSAGAQSLTLTCSIDGVTFDKSATISVADTETSVSASIDVPIRKGSLDYSLISSNVSDTSVTVTATLRSDAVSLPLDTGLMAAYLLSPSLPCSDGTARDESGNGAHIRILSAESGPNRDRLIYDGSAESHVFSGTAGSDFDVFNVKGKPFTLSMLVTPHAGNTEGAAQFFTMSNNTGANRAFIFYYSPATKTIKALLDNGGTIVNLTSPVVVEGEEYEVVLRYDQTTAYLMVDGVEDFVALAGPLDTVEGGKAAAALGRRFTGTPEFLGVLRDIKFWHRFLDDDEIIGSRNWTPAKADRGEINVALLMGQSNTNGVEDASFLSDPTMQLTTPESFIADGRAPHKYWRAVYPTSGETPTYMGIEVGLSQSLGTDWAIIKYGHSATSLFADWQPAGASWLAAEAHIAKYLSELTQMGYTIGKVILVDVRGEADTILQVNAEAYQANWDTYFAAVESVVGKSCGSVQSRLSDAQLGTASYAYLPTVQNQQDLIAAADPFTRAIVNTDTLTISAETVNPNHFDADSILLNGHRLGQAVKRLAATMVDVVAIPNAATSAELTAAEATILADADTKYGALSVQSDTSEANLTALLTTDGLAMTDETYLSTIGGNEIQISSTVSDSLVGHAVEITKASDSQKHVAKLLSVNDTDRDQITLASLPSFSLTAGDFVEIYDRTTSEAYYAKESADAAKTAAEAQPAPLDATATQAATAAALAAYDPPTRVELATDTQAIITQGDSAWVTGASSGGADVYELLTTLTFDGDNATLKLRANKSGTPVDFGDSLTATIHKANGIVLQSAISGSSAIGKEAEYTFASESVEDMVGVYITAEGDIDGETRTLSASHDGDARVAAEAGGGSLSVGAVTLKGDLSSKNYGDNDYVEIVQGESKVLTFLMEPSSGFFASATPTSIQVEIKDPSGTKITITNADVTRVTEANDIQVFRVTLSTTDTESLSKGIAKIEVTIDDQKAQFLDILRIVETF